MTVYESIRSKSIDELAEWLLEFSEWKNAPWLNWFDQKHCDQCDAIKGHFINIDGTEDEHEHLFGYCEMYDQCKFFPEINGCPDDLQVIKMWLKSEV